MQEYKKGIFECEEFYKFMNYIYKLSKDEKLCDLSTDDLLFFIANEKNILFYLSKSYINDNFIELLEQVDIELIKEILSGKAYDVFTENCFFIDNDIITNDLLNNQHFEISPKLFDNPIYALGIVRNNLSHFNYDVEVDKVVIDDKIKKEKLVFSVDSLILLLLAAFSNQGQSYKKGAFDYFVVGNNIVSIINKDDENQYTPYDMKLEIQSSFEKAIRINKCVYTLDEFLEDATNILNEYGNYEIKVETIDTKILKKLKIEKINTQEDMNLYVSYTDNIRCATISYKLIITMLHLLTSDKMAIHYNEFKKYFPIINNTLFISYMTLVFNDYMVHDCDGFIEDVFESIDEEYKIIPKIKKVPIKLRNSLNHARYKFYDILDDSKGIIIEFWDQDKNEINFSCKITKENALKLIKKYLETLKIKDK